MGKVDPMYNPHIKAKDRSPGERKLFCLMWGDFSSLEERKKFARRQPIRQTVNWYDLDWLCKKLVGYEV